MNIHEHQAKELLKEYGAPIPKGIVGFSVEEILSKIKELKSEKFVIKAQIHAGGRGKAGGITVVNNIDEVKQATAQLFGKILVTHQTGMKGKKVNRIYVEEASIIKKEFYLSCLVDRATSRITFISCSEGGMDIEEVANKKPEKIVTTKIKLSNEVSESDCKKIVDIFNLEYDANDQAINLIQSIYKLFLEKDASLIEINPLILTNENNILCLDAKINFDDNAIFRHPEIYKMKDLNEEDPKEIEASKYDLSFIKLDGNIGCMVNGAGLAMATMDIIKSYGGEPANFLDVGGGASKEKVTAAFKLILSDESVKGILINIFGGIMRCDVLAEGVVSAAKEMKIKIPLVVRLAGTNFEQGKKILDNSGLKIISALDLSDAAKKIVNEIE